MQVQANNDSTYKVQTRWLFHSHIKIKIPASCHDSIFDSLYKKFEEIDKNLNSHSLNSSIDRINKNAENYTSVDDETIKVLDDVLSLSDLLDGEYDISIMPLIRLWQFYSEGGKSTPQKEDIESALKSVDYKQIKTEGKKVKINKGQEITTGSFLKSYASDRVVNLLLENGISDAIINAGGSSIKAVNNILHPFWKVNVFHPDNENELLFSLKMGNACLSTSAQSKTYVEIDGVRYGHIISPKSGYPSLNKQIGIITPDCFRGDILSTGLYNLTLDKFEEKIEELSQIFPVSGYLMNNNKEIRFAGGFEKYIVQ